VPLIVIAQQHRRHRPAGQLGIGHLRRLARPGPGQAERGDDAVGQFDLKCGQESAQVGDHDDFPRSDVCEHADLGHSSPVSQQINDGVRQHAMTCAEFPVIDLGESTLAGASRTPRPPVMSHSDA